MKKVSLYQLLAIVILITLVISCSTGQKTTGKNCGCGSRKGFVGY
jgi:hypothetical protein